MKTRILITLVAAIAVTAILAGLAPGQTPAGREGVFIHVSHGTDDPHRVLMALQMAEKMSVDRDVLVYFDIRGVEVALKDAEDMHMAPFAGLKKQLALLSERGVTLMVCPGCLEAAGKKPLDLAPGFKIAEKERFFNFTDGRILTLDY
jgi:predicted peroxiredoxin